MEILNRIKNKLEIARMKLSETGFFHVFGSSTINKVIGFASTWIIVRLISKPEYGVYTSASNIYNFFLLLSGLGISSAVLQLCSESNDIDRRTEIYRYGMRFGLGVNIVLAILIVSVGLWIPLSIDGSNVLLIMMCGLPIAVFIPEMQFLYLRSNLQNKAFSKANTLNSILVMILSCFFAWLWKAPGLIFADYAAHIIIAVYTARKYNAPIDCRKAFLGKNDKKAIFSIAIISMMNNGLGHLMYLLDIFVLGIFAPDSSVIASYKIATNLPTAMSFIPAALMVYLYPYFARHKDDGDWLIGNYKKVVIPFALFNACVTVGLILFSNPIIKILFGAQYLDSVIPFRILSVSFFFSATFRTVSGNLLVTQRKLNFNLIMGVLSSIINTVLNIIMIQKWESNGAAIATLITCMITGLISTAYLLVTFKKVRLKNKGAKDENPGIGE